MGAAAKKRAAERRRQRRARRKARARGNTVVIGRDGPPCPGCGNLMQVRAHSEITAQELRKRFYFGRWYRCTNPDCNSTEVMPLEFVVWNEAGGERRPADDREPLTPKQLERDAQRRRHERLIGNAPLSVRPNPNVPIGWPSDGSIPPWATEEERRRREHVPDTANIRGDARGLQDQQEQNP
jgi:hypothetical protein